MKKVSSLGKLIFVGLLATAVLIPAIAQNPANADMLDEINGSDSSNDMDDLDSLFEEAEDTTGTEATSTELPKQTAVEISPIFKLNSSINAKLGFVEQCYPEEDHWPYAYFKGTLGATARPSSDLCIRAEGYVKFPKMAFVLDTFYFDYIMMNRLYVTAGRTNITWGNAHLFDTNVLDDKRGDVTDVSIFDTDNDDEKADDNTSSSHPFYAIATIPIRHGQLQMLAKYIKSDEIDPAYVSYGMSFEYPVKGFALNVFVRTWPDYKETGGSDDCPNSEYMDPAVGAQITGELLNFHLTAWGKAHLPKSDPLDFSYAKFVGGIGRIWTAPEKIGFLAEYQYTYNNMLDKDESENRFSNNVAFTLQWRKMLGSRFSPTIQWYHDIEDRCGSVIPSVSVSGLPYANVTFLAPIFYGNQSVSYNNFTVTSTSDKPAVLLGIMFTIDASF